MNALRFAITSIGLSLAIATNGCAVAEMNVDDAGQDAARGTDASTTDTRTTSDSGARDSGSGGSRDVVFSLGDSGGGGTGSVPLYGHCAASSDCRDTGAGCLTVFPGGLCSKACTTNADCGSGTCLDTGNGSVCLPSCTSGGGECGAVGGMCVPIDANATMFACLPGCFASGAPAGTPSCTNPLTCDPYAGICTSTPSTGADNGAACAADADCRGGRCIVEVDMGTPSGFLGGYCLSFGVSVAIMQGAPVPQGSCPTGSGAVPINGERPGDSVPCFKTCSANSDCRAGYQCDHLTPGSGTGQFFSNGICLPVDCSTAGMTCPSGTHCVSMTGTGGAMFGTCAH